MYTSGGSVRVTHTSKSMKVRVRGRKTKENFKWCLELESGCREKIECVNNQLKGLNLKLWRKRGLNERRAKNFINNANGTFGLSILLRCAGTRKPNFYSIFFKKKIKKRLVVKLMTCTKILRRETERVKLN